MKTSLYHSIQAKSDTAEKEEAAPFFSAEKKRNNFFSKPQNGSIIQRQTVQPVAPVEPVPPVPPAQPVPPVMGNCPEYEPNEIPRSRTAAGVLTQDFTTHSTDELLFADFGNDHSFVKRNALTEALWLTWKRNFTTDGSYRIKITGYSDCSGIEAVNISIRQNRAENIQRAFGPRIERKISFRGMQALGQYVTGNDTPENRARNRSVVIKYKQGFFTQAEAVANSNEAAIAVRTALAQLGSSQIPRERNVPAYLTQYGITVLPLTPRHEGTVVTPDISFFAGTNYSLNFNLRSTTRFHVYDSGTKLAIQARNMPDIEAMATIPQIKDRILQAVTQMAHLRAAGPARAGSVWEQYKAQFNAWWFVEPYRSMAPLFNPSLDSFGPRYNRAREIFRKIYSEDATIRDEYDHNYARLKERIDSYNVPEEGYNTINSPRLQALREVFLSVRPPVTAAGYPAFKTAIETASAPLDGADRMQVAESSDWQGLINWYVRNEANRTEIRSIIRTHHGAPGASTAAPVGAAPTGRSAPTGSARDIREFLRNIRIQGSSRVFNSTHSQEAIRLTPRSSRTNPGVEFDTRFRVEPAARVISNAVTPEVPWPAGDRRGASADVIFANSGAVTMTAYLDVLNLPAGITAPVVPAFNFEVIDNRQSRFLSEWQPELVYGLPGGNTTDFETGDTVRFVNGAQNFEVSVRLRSGGVNQGLAINVVSRLKQGGRVIQSNAAHPREFADGAYSSTPIVFSVSRPATVPATGIPYEIEIDVTDVSGTVLDTKTVRLSVLDEILSNQADAMRHATEDYNYFRGAFIPVLRARGGLADRVATALTTPDADGGITLLPLTARHDSADYVSRSSGGPDPTRTGYFVGVDYSNSMVAEVSAGGFHTAQFPGLGRKVIVVNRTPDITSGDKRSDDSVIGTLTHEAVHAMDEVPNSSSLIERYRTEFRAYWMEGEYGPPDQSDCNLVTTGTGPCYDAEYLHGMPPPGPKSSRARAIFDFMYGSTTYDWLQPEYDINPTFRRQVDTYLYPDGINLIVSVRLERLRALIEGYTGTGFAALRTQVRQYMGHGAAPAGGVLDPEEILQIRNNRAWRDLVDRKIRNAVDRTTLKTELSIPNP